METIDDETIDAAIEFIKKTVKCGKPFFVWWNGTQDALQNTCKRRT